MKFAKIESVYRPNLLINGDFNVNQRGQSSYSGESAKATYTLDMWYLSASAYVSATINSDGSVTFMNSHPSSELSLSQSIGGELSYPLTAVIKLQGEAPASVKFTAEGMVSISDDCAVQIVDDGNRHIFQIRCSAGKSITIEYAALYEGEVAFNHVREDYATALMRCQQYLRAGYYIGSCIFSYSDGTKLFSFCYENMKSTVTAKLNINYYTDRGESHETTNYSIDSTLNGRITFTLNDTTANAIQNGSVRIYAELSCEP